MACVGAYPAVKCFDEDVPDMTGRRRSSKVIELLDASSDSESAKATTRYTDDDGDDCESICSLATDDGYWEASVRSSLSYSSSPSPSIVRHNRSNSSSSSSSKARIHDVDIDVTSDHAGNGVSTLQPVAWRTTACHDDRAVSNGSFVPVGMPVPCMGALYEAVFVPVNMPVWGYSLQQASLAGQPLQQHPRARALARKGPPSSHRCHDEQQEVMAAEQTTLIMRNLPTNCTRDALRHMLDNEGFASLYDFIHVPVDFQSKSCLGYALVNLVNSAVAAKAHMHFRGFTKWSGLQDSRACEVAWNEPKQQGLAALTERYRNSSLMHPSIADSIRPQIFQDGIAVAFPAPTMRLRPPRLRHQKSGTRDCL